MRKTENWKKQKARKGMRKRQLWQNSFFFSLGWKCHKQKSIDNTDKQCFGGKEVTSWKIKSYHLKRVKISSKTWCKNMGKDMKTGNSQKSKSEWPAYTLKDVRFFSRQCKKKKKLKSSNEVLHPAKIQVQ